MPWYNPPVGGPSPGGCGFASVVYVDPVNGNDATGQRGKPCLPFRTITAGLAAGMPGDSVLLAPATYPENVIWPDTDNLALIGSSPLNTVILPAAGDGIAWVASIPGLGGGSIIGVLIGTMDPAGAALRLDAGTQTDFLFRGFLLNVGAILNFGGGSPAVFVAVGSLEMHDIFVLGGDVIYRECGRAHHSDCDFEQVDIRYDFAAVVQPASGRVSFNYYGCRISKQLTLRNSPVVIGDKACFVDTVTADGLVKGGMMLPFFAPWIEWHGVINSVDFGSAPSRYLPPFSFGSMVNTTVDFDEAIIKVGLNAETQPGGTDPQPIYWRAGVAPNTPGGLLWGNAVGSLVNVDMKRTSWQAQTDFAGVGPGGFLDRSVWLGTSTLVAGGNIIPIFPAFPAAMSGYNVNVQSSGIFPGAIFVVNTKTNVNFVIGMAGAIGPTEDVEWIIARPA